MTGERLSFPTLAVHAGDTVELSKASAPSLALSSTFLVSEPLSFSGNEVKETDPWCYTRWGNPTVRQLENKLAALEGSKPGHCVTFASGMAASSAVMFSLLQAGDHLVVSDTCYPGVAEMFQYTLPKFGIECTSVDASNTANIEAALRPGKTKLVWIETPCNPILRLTDVSASAELAHSCGAELVVDTTFATPAITRPISDHGADFVVHSLSKYMCGHGDALGGAVIARDQARASVLRAEAAIHHGGVLAPFNAFLINRGVATLPIRMKQHSKNATAVAQWLESHESIEQVSFPFLESHPQHDLAKAQMDLASGMVSFRVPGGAAGAEALARRMMGGLEVAHYAVSLGHHRSLVYFMSTADLAERAGSPYALTGAQLEAYRSWAGDGVFRLSVGLEDPKDLIKDLDRALS